MDTKALTKALHTVRVVEVIARLLVMAGARPTSAADLFARVLGSLDNGMPTDAALRDKCIAACRKVLA